MDELNETEQVNLRVIIRFPLTFWLIAACFSIYSLSMLAFDSFSMNYLQASYGENTKLIASIPHLVLIFLTPVLGLFIDQVGKKTIFSKYKLLNL